MTHDEWFGAVVQAGMAAQRNDFAPAHRLAHLLELGEQAGIRHEDDMPPAAASQSVEALPEAESTAASPMDAEQPTSDTLKSWHRENA